MNTDTGGGRGFTQETINRLKKYGIEYYTSDGHPNISLTNIILKQYIENEFNTNFDSDTTKNIEHAHIHTYMRTYIHTTLKLTFLLLT
jgi:hypothetical protein